MDTNLHEPERSTFDVQPVGHSAGGPDALHDAGALDGCPFDRAALRHASVAAAVRCGAYGRVTTGSESHRSARGRARAGRQQKNQIGGRRGRC
jgi:hypothetical protein